MKRVLASCLVAALCIATVAVAGDTMEGKKVEGTISKVDLAAKTMTVKDASGNETAIYWSDATKVEGGALKEGEKVHIKAAEKDGKMWASYVHVGEMKKM